MDAGTGVGRRNPASPSAGGGGARGRAPRRRDRTLRPGRRAAVRIRTRRAAAEVTREPRPPPRYRAHRRRGPAARRASRPTRVPRRARPPAVPLPGPVRPASTRPRTPTGDRCGGRPSTPGRPRPSTPSTPGRPRPPVRPHRPAGPAGPRRRRGAIPSVDPTPISETAGGRPWTVRTQHQNPSEPGHPQSQ